MAIGVNTRLRLSGSLIKVFQKKNTDSPGSFERNRYPNCWNVIGSSKVMIMTVNRVICSSFRVPEYGVAWFGGILPVSTVITFQLGIKIAVYADRWEICRAKSCSGNAQINRSILQKFPGIELSHTRKPHQGSFNVFKTTIFIVESSYSSNQLNRFLDNPVGRVYSFFSSPILGYVVWLYWVLFAGFGERPFGLA